MDIESEDKQRDEFRKILLDLAQLQFSFKDPLSKSKMYQRLEKLYYAPNDEDKYRHFYSDIFSVLTQIHQGDQPGSIDVLGQNLAEIRRGYQVLHTDENGKKIDIRDSLKKLYDHVSLDIARISYSDAADRKVEQKESIAQIKTEVGTAQKSIDKAKRDLKTLDSQVVGVRKTVGDIQKEYIAILGIFAAIVLAFTGGIAFSTSVLENMHLVSIYRVVIVALIIGLVLINILYALFYYISQLVHGTNTQRLSPLGIANGVLLALLLLTVMAWKAGVVEHRNSEINANVDQCVTVIESSSADEIEMEDSDDDAEN